MALLFRNHLRPAGENSPQEQRVLLAMSDTAEEAEAFVVESTPEGDGMYRRGPILRGKQYYQGNPWRDFLEPKGNLDPSTNPGLLTNPYRDDGTAHLPGNTNDTGLYTRNNYWFTGSKVIQGTAGGAYYRNLSNVHILVAGGLIPGNEQPGAAMTIVPPNGQEIQAIRPPRVNETNPRLNNGGQPEIYNSVGDLAPVDAIGWKFSNARPGDDPRAADYGTPQYAYKTDVATRGEGDFSAGLASNEGYDPELSQQPGYGIAQYVRNRVTGQERLIGLIFIDYQAGRRATVRLWGDPRGNPHPNFVGASVEFGNQQFAEIAPPEQIEFVYEYQTPREISAALDRKVGQDGYLTTTVFSTPGDESSFVGGGSSTPLSKERQQEIQDQLEYARSVDDQETVQMLEGILATHKLEGEEPPPVVRDNSGNPLPFDIFTADPSARVVDDTLWIMPSHDPEGATYWSMTDYIPFSTTDLVNWEKGDVAFSVDDVSWAQEVYDRRPQESTSQGVYLYAPDFIERNGKFYLYFPVTEEAIGVAVSDTPGGPYVDAIGKPLVDRSNSLGAQRVFDPGVFIDDDGQAYMVFGGGDEGTDARIVKLGDDMVSLDGPVQKIEGLPRFFEAAHLHKRGETYYLSYSAKYQGYTTIDYATATDPMGPWTYQGTILESVPGWTNHHSIVDYKGKSLLFYHVGSATDFTRRTAVEEFTYNNDGTIPLIERTQEGASAV